MKIIDVLLPILIILIPLLNVLIKAASRKKQLKSMPDEDAMPGNPLITSSEEEVVMIPERKMPELSRRSHIRAVTPMEGVQAAAKREAQSAKTPKNPETTPKGALFGDKEEIRRAVILTEVLNRKYE